MKEEDIPKEIERKFHIRDETWCDEIEKQKEIIQGYLFLEGKKNVRVRLTENKAFLTIKAPTATFARAEYEYEIPYPHASAMIETLAEGRVLKKTRYEVHYEGKLWEIDVYKGPLEGLSVAEIELTSEEESFALPPWLGEEITNDTRYLNAALALAQKKPEEP